MPWCWFGRSWLFYPNYGHGTAVQIVNALERLQLFLPQIHILSALLLAVFASCSNHQKTSALILWQIITSVRTGAGRVLVCIWSNQFDQVCKIKRLLHNNFIITELMHLFICYFIFVHIISTSPLSLSMFRFIICCWKTSALKFHPAIREKAGDPKTY